MSRSALTQRGTRRVWGVSGQCNGSPKTSTERDLSRRHWSQGKAREVALSGYQHTMRGLTWAVFNTTKLESVGNVDEVLRKWSLRRLKDNPIRAAGPRSSTLGGKQVGDLCKEVRGLSQM